MISYMDSVVKVWEDFEHYVTYDVGKPKHLREKPNIEKDSIRFESKQWSNCDLTTKLFISNT
jgi:hypothetical protein